MKLFLQVHLIALLLLSGSVLIAQERSIDNLFIQHDSWQKRFDIIKTMPEFNREQKEKKIQAVFDYLGDIHMHQIRVKNSILLIQSELDRECEHYNFSSDEYSSCFRLGCFVLAQGGLFAIIENYKEQVQQLQQELSESLAHEVESKDHNAGSNDQSEATGEQSESSVASDTPVQE